MDKIKNNIWGILVLLFALSILLFGVKRAKHDLRWSAWAMGDAQVMNAALHFANEGFRNHYFLTYYHPGYLGKKSGFAESEVGYYTRYPPLGTIFNGIIFRWFGESRVLLNSIAVFFSFLTLLISYLVFSYFFSKRAAFFSTLFIGTSVGFLQFIDCPSLYAYSEFARFLILLTFLYSEKTKGHRALHYPLILALWTFLFCEAFNSLDYYFFPQLFFLLYYCFSKQKIPIAKLSFLASAPILSFALHIYQSKLALQNFGLSAFNALTIGGMENERVWITKMVPFNKGVSHILSFITYFFRMMEQNMVRDNFGFGFAAIFLMFGALMLLRHSNDKIRTVQDKETGIPFGRVLLLFAIPSVSWWVIFPNHAATFFYTPMHAFPIIGLIFGLCVDSAIQTIGKPKPNALRVTSSFILLGCFWHIFIFTGKYLKEYPNLFDPTQRVTLGYWGNLNTHKISEMAEVSKAIRRKTSYGDIILVPAPFEMQEYFFGYYSQRRMDGYGGDVAQLKEKIEALESYRKQGSKKYKIFNPNLKLFALVDENESGEIKKYLSSNFKIAFQLGPKWTLLSLDK